MRSVKILITIILFTSYTAVVGQRVGINTTTPDGNLHIKGASSIPFPNLRITDTLDNFARIKMETVLGGDRFWDIAASSTPDFTYLNFYFKNDTLGANIFQINPESGIHSHRSLTSDVRAVYYANENEYQGTVGYIDEHLYLLSGRPEGQVRIGTRNFTRMTLDTIGRLGLRTLSPKYLADFRSTDNFLTGGELQLATPSETNFLRLFGGRQGDPNPFIAFHESDTFHLVTTSADWTTYKRRMTMLPNGYLGLGTDKPIAELDIVSADIDDGVEMHLSNLDTSHFLRLYSGRENLPNPIMYWHQGDALQLGMANPDESDYQQFLSLDGKTIGVHNNGGSVLIGQGSGINDDLTENFNTAVGYETQNSNTSGMLNTAIGAYSLYHNQDISFLVAIGDSALYWNGSEANDAFDGTKNTAVGSKSLMNNKIGRENTAIGFQALKENIGGWNNTAVGDSALHYNGISQSLTNTSSNNTAVGSRALLKNDGGYWNSAFGAHSLRDNVGGCYNTALGLSSLIFNTEGTANSAVGVWSLRNNIDGVGNSVVGYRAMDGNTGGDFNVSMGHSSMYNTTTGDENVAIGESALYNNTIGKRNVAIGKGAGYNAEGYDGNIYLGFEAGKNAIESNRLYIDNTSNPSPLIYGEFNTNLIRINGRQEVTGDLTIGDAFVVDESLKRVGIGTLLPSYPLDIAGTLNLNKNIPSGVAMRVNADEALWYDGNYFSWGFGAVHNYIATPLTIGPLEGSTTPFAKLHVVDNAFTYLQVESHSGDAILQLSGNTDAPSIGWTMRRDVSDGGKLQWRSDDFKKMTLTPGGNLGIGVNSESPAYTLYVNGNAGKPDGGSWTNSSDRRLKQNIDVYADGLEKILEIDPVTFQYNEKSGYDTDPQYVGVIAQELQSVAPYMVSENDEGYLQVNNSAMTYMLINAVQELNTQNEKLQEVINKLISQLDAQDSAIQALKAEVNQAAQ